MASSIYIRDADATEYYLSGPAGNRYTGTGGPWLTQATTPYRIGMNEKAPPWTPTASVPQEVYGGGPPFRTGSELLWRGYPNVTETVHVQMYGSSHNNAVYLLRLLRRALSSSLTGRLPLLVVQPDGATNAVAYEIYSATIQETPDFINEEAGNYEIRVAITWTRSPFGGNFSGGGETLINAVTAANTYSGGSPNAILLSSSATGELIREGGPLTVEIDANTSPWTEQTNRIMVAVVDSRIGTANTTAINTTSTTGALITTITGLATNLDTTRGIKGRVLVRTTSPSTNLELQARIGIGSADPFYRTPWVRVTPGSVTAAMSDLGAFTAPLYGTGITSSLSIAIYARSTDGSAATASLSYIEKLEAYTVCETPTLTTNGTITIQSFQPSSGYAHLPVPPRLFTSAGQFGVLRGRPPVYIDGTSLYVMWRGENNQHYTADSAIITVRHAPLFHTLRGNG